MMSKSSKWITGIVATIICLALLAFAGIWRLGLLPLLLPPPLPPQPLAVSEGETVQPSGEIYLSQQGSKIATESGEGNLSQPGSTVTTTPNSPSSSTESQLQQEIETRYTTEMQNVTKDYEDQLNALVGKAYNEYTTDRKQGKPVSAMALAMKYTPMGNALEKQCDDQFYALLDQFKAELLSNGFPLTAALRAQQVYDYDKAVREREILTAAAKI